MGDLATDTTVVPADAAGRYVADISRDWEIWGPNGGYMAALALRAAGAEAGLSRPASFACHFLSVADFGEVAIEVVGLRRSRKAESYRVSMGQGDRNVLEALVWFVADVDGLEHSFAKMPDVPPPDALPTIAERFEAEGEAEREAPHSFWNNFSARPVDWLTHDAIQIAQPPELREWFQYLPTPAFDDPVVESARVLLLLDTMLWPAAWRAHPGQDVPYVAPSMDVMAAFHALPERSEWLLCHATSPVAGDGLVGGSSAVWSEDGRLLGSAVSQMLCRPNPMFMP